MIRFLRKLSEPLKYGALIIAGSLYIWALIFLLKSDNWVGISALTTMLLAIAAFWAIWQNTNIQKNEKRERLLNEIIEWAINVTNWRSESKKIFKEMAGITDSKQQQVLTHAHIVEVKEGFVGMGGRNQYISSIAEKFTKVLQEAVEKLITDLEAYIEFLDDWQRVKADEIVRNLDAEYEYYTKADELALQIDESTNKVIEEATKIKTRDVG